MTSHSMLLNYFQKQAYPCDEGSHLKMLSTPAISKSSTPSSRVPLLKDPIYNDLEFYYPSFHIVPLLFILLQYIPAQCSIIIIISRVIIYFVLIAEHYPWNFVLSIKLLSRCERQFCLFIRPCNCSDGTFCRPLFPTLSF